MITQNELKKLLSYDPETGVFTRVTSRRGSRPTVGTIRPDGYCSICVNYKSYLAHRLAWLWMTGDHPSDQVDHINGNRSDNRWCNLRSATNKQNSENCRLYSCNKTGVRGAVIDKRTGKYIARIRHFGKDVHVGVFDDAESADRALKDARDKLFTHHKTEYAA